jgi:SAM-dependent methyltransferase
MDRLVMYSSSWYETFAATMSAEVNAAERRAICRLAPPGEFPELLDVGCGDGRSAAGLAEAGYRVTGIDVNAAAIAQARQRVPMATFLVLDQREVATLPDHFDIAIILWNSIGFASREGDGDVLRQIACVLRPAGRLILDMYHPDWLKHHEQHGVRDARGATIHRWCADGRSHHRIEYDNGTVDHIDFNVYRPDEITELLRAAGFEVSPPMVWWTPVAIVSGADARYQLVAQLPNAP